MTNSDLPAADYEPLVRELLAEACPPVLGPGTPWPGVRERLVQLTAETLGGDRRGVALTAAQCCLAGLWLRFNYLSESHQLSQGIAHADGSYWHGIMHRREPDYPNAKYWFRRVGNHPLFAPLLIAARQIVAREGAADSQLNRLVHATHWDPDRFIDLCEASTGHGGATESACCAIAHAEWELLFAACYRHALGLAH